MAFLFFEIKNIIVPLIMLLRYQEESTKILNNTRQRNNHLREKLKEKEDSERTVA